MRRSILIGVAALGFWSGAANADEAGRLAEDAWLGPGTDRAAVLSSRPRECLRVADDPDTAYLVDLGRVAFQSSFLLGGLAARQGLSCESCHRGGHDNPHFQMPGLSGEPGTADVTSGLLSKTRGDDVFNPVPIPTLYGAAAKPSLGTVRPAPSLDAFIHSAIVEEFQGAEPPASIRDGLAAYIRHLDTDCPNASEPITEASMVSEIRNALETARLAWARGDQDAADFLVLSAQGAFGRLHARYGVAGLSAPQDWIAALALRTGAARSALSADDPGAINEIAALVSDLEALEPRLAAMRAQSLFNPVHLAKEADTAR